MQIALAIVGHAVLIPLMFSGLAALLVAVYRLDRNTTAAGRHFAAPLDRDIVERWNRAGDAPAPGH